MKKKPGTDFSLANEGSISLLTPLTEAAKDWVSEHIPEDAQWFGNGVVVEHRYIADIVAGIQNDGLRVRDTTQKDLDQALDKVLKTIDKRPRRRRRKASPLQVLKIFLDELAKAKQQCFDFDGEHQTKTLVN